MTAAVGIMILMTLLLRAVLAALAYLALAAASSLPAKLSLAGALAVVGLVAVVDAGRRLAAREARRRAADAWLLSATGRSIAPAHAWRVDRLCSVRERKSLARALRRHVAWAQRRGIRLAAASDNRRAIRRSAPLLDQLARRLDDLERPVTPAGVLLLHRLLTEGSSPLYSRRRGHELPASVASIARVLDEAGARPRPGHDA